MGVKITGEGDPTLRPLRETRNGPRGPGQAPGPNGSADGDDGMADFGTPEAAQEDLMLISDVSTRFVEDGIAGFETARAGNLLAAPGFAQRIDRDGEARLKENLADIANPERDGHRMVPRAARVLAQRLESRRTAFRKFAEEKEGLARTQRARTAVTDGIARLRRAAHANPEFLPLLADEMELMTIGNRAALGGDAGLEEMRSHTRPLLYEAAVHGHLRRGEFDEATRLVVRKGPLDDNQVRALAATVKGASRAAKQEGLRTKAGEARRARDGVLTARARAVARLETDLASGAVQDGAIAAARSAGHIGKDEVQRYKSMLDARDARAEHDTVTLERIDSALSGTNTLDPANREDRAAADLHYQRTLASDEEGAAPDLLLATVRRTRIAPESAVDMLRGKLIAGTDEERIGAARTLSDLFDIDSDAGRGLNAPETGLIHAIVRLDGRGIAAAKIAEFTKPLTQQALDGMFRSEPPEAIEDQPGAGTRTLKIREGDTGETIPIPLAGHSNAPEILLAASDGGAGATSAQRARDTVRSITGAPGDERQARDTRDGANKVAKPKRSDAAYAPKPLPEPTKELLKKRLDGRDILEVFAPDPKNKWPGITPEMAKKGGEARVGRALERLMVFDKLKYTQKKALFEELGQLKKAGAIPHNIIQGARSGVLSKTKGNSERYISREELLSLRGRVKGGTIGLGAIGAIVGLTGAPIPGTVIATIGQFAAEYAPRSIDGELRNREQRDTERQFREKDKETARLLREKDKESARRLRGKDKEIEKLRQELDKLKK